MVRRVVALTLVISCVVLVGVIFGFAQDAGAARKVVSQVSPAYPALARQMHISGNVRLEAVVAPDGKVKSMNIKGGHPILVQAATDAVSKWKWEPAKDESREPVELKFIPAQ